MSDNREEGTRLTRRGMLSLATVGGLTGCLHRGGQRGEGETQHSEYPESNSEAEDDDSFFSVPELSWSFPTKGKMRGSPAVVDGVLFIGSYDGYLYSLGEPDALETADFGELSYPAFKYDTRGSSTVDTVGLGGAVEELWRFETHGRIFQTPVVAHGNVYVGSEDNSFYSISADSGEENWSFDTGKVISSTSAAATEDTIYVGAGTAGSSEYDEDGVLYALHPEDGQIKWRVDRDAGIGATPTIADDVLYFGCQDESFYALDTADGSEVWSFQGEDYFCGSKAAVKDGVVYVGSEDNSMYALDADDGSLIWEFETNDMVVSSPVATDDAVYFGSNDGNTYAVDVESGEEVWRDEDSKVFGSPAYSDGVVYSPSVSGNLNALDAETGERIWTYNTPMGISSSPVVAEDVIYFGGQDDRVYAVENRLVDEDGEYGAYVEAFPEERNRKPEGAPTS